MEIHNEMIDLDAITHIDWEDEQSEDFIGWRVPPLDAIIKAAQLSQEINRFARTWWKSAIIEEGEGSDEAS